MFCVNYSRKKLNRDLTPTIKALCKWNRAEVSREEPSQFPWTAGVWNNGSSAVHNTPSLLSSRLTHKCHWTACTYYALQMGSQWDPGCFYNLEPHGGGFKIQEGYIQIRKPNSNLSWPWLAEQTNFQNELLNADVSKNSLDWIQTRIHTQRKTPGMLYCLQK